MDLKKLRNTFGVGGGTIIKTPTVYGGGTLIKEFTVPKPAAQEALNLKLI